MKLFSALVIALLALIGSLIAESEKENVIIVLDASGSMWGQVNQEPKISIAKRVVQDLVNDWSLSSDIGLIAYGHRRKGDCKDIETIIPVSSPDPAQFKKVLSSLSAKGKTPLSDAVENAAETLKYKENAATVILVSDGIETCDRDPCKLASALESSGVNFTTHVVGFDLSQEDQGKIRCIADNTGGKFLAAHDAESLKASMEEAIQEITQVKADVRLQAVAAVDQGSIKVTSWELYAGSDLKETSSSEAPSFNLESGEYTAKATVDGLSGEASFRLENDRSIVVKVPVNGYGLLNLTAAEEAGGTPIEVDKWEVSHANGDSSNNTVGPIVKRSNQSFLLLPGRYRVKVTTGKVEHEEIVEVSEGKNDREVIVKPQGTLELKAVTKPGGEALKVNHWYVFKIDENGVMSEEAVEHSYQQTPNFTLLPGKYLVRVVDSKVTHEEAVEVIASKKNKYEIVIATQGTLELSAVTKTGGEALKVNHWYIFPVDENGEKKEESVDHSYQKIPKFTLIPGTYIVHIVDDKVTHDEKVEVIGGKNNKYEIVIATQGTLELSAVTKAGGEPLKVNHWYIFPVDEHGEMKEDSVDHSYQKTPHFTLIPGKYIVRVIDDKVTHEQEIEVVGGKKSKYEIVIAAQGTLTVSAVEKTGAKPLKVNHWYVYEIDENGERADKEMEHSYREVPTFTLLPGRYVVRVIVNKVEKEQEVEITAGKKTALEIVLPAQGVVQLKAVDQAGGPALKIRDWAIFSFVDGEPVEEHLDHSYSSSPKFTLLPGKYLAKVNYAKVVKEQEFEVVGGKTVSMEVLLPAQGLLAVTAVKTPNGEPLKVNEWKVYKVGTNDDESKQFVEQSYSREPKFTLLPGSYLVEVRKDGVFQELEVTVEARRTTKEEIVFKPSAE